MKWSTLRNLMTADIDAIECEQSEVLETVQELRDEGYTWDDIDEHLTRMVGQALENPSPLTMYFRG